VIFIPGEMKMICGVRARQRRFHFCGDAIERKDAGVVKGMRFPQKYGQSTKFLNWTWVDESSGRKVKAALRARTP